MRLKSDKERRAECLRCKYVGICGKVVSRMEEYEDGSCKTKDTIRRLCEEPESEG